MGRPHAAAAAAAAAPDARVDAEKRLGGVAAVAATKTASALDWRKAAAPAAALRTSGV